MDLARTLIRSVVRAFYETRHVLVIDALMIHSALPNEDLALLLGMQPKDLRKLCGRLREDRLLAVHSRQETREGQQRPINKDYYYIDFHATIDAIKYRIFNLTQKVKDMYTPSEEKKDYHCPRCKAQWTLLEVLDSSGPMGFICHRCSGILEEKDRGDGESTGHEKQSILMGQLEFLLKLLRQIDSQDIPSNTFETAFAVAIPVKRNEDVNPLRATAPLDAGRNPPTAVKGLAPNALQPLEISVTTTSERTAAENDAEVRRKAEIAAQNALPVWHTASTVTGERTTNIGGKAGRDTMVNCGGASSLKAEEDVEDKKKVRSTMDDELTAYYAQMQKEKEKEAREDREAEEDDEDDDDGEDEFEDVGISVDGAGTPQSSFSTTNINGLKSALTNGGIKREIESESGSSAPVTGRSTPAASQPVVEDEQGLAAKRVKVETNGAAGGAADIGDKYSDEDEDDADFEDAL